ncbi:MAG: hypothetical protein EOO50_15020 [Flavobacterium sp.]|uniref:hypothetical protein n=1 Tax=Flavobacterium sp. TaxID=239 RepID=UPI0011FE6BE7|nr:hypothetical protein [Flavobacterium sp.]RZJ65148.1 MAG: hypothetical protein EOO50_15020 [Flavobacterium sp.]
MEPKKPDTTAPGIDYQQSEVNDYIVNDAQRIHAPEMHDAVEKDRAFYESPNNPGKKFNQNDQAYSQSSPNDFSKTHSKFHHADDNIQDLNPDK